MAGKLCNQRNADGTRCRRRVAQSALGCGVHGQASTWGKAGCPVVDPVTGGPLGDPLGDGQLGASGLPAAEIARRAEKTLELDRSGLVYEGSEEAAAWAQGVLALADPGCPARVLRAAYRSDSGLLRRTAMENPSCPVGVLVHFWATAGSKTLLARHRRVPRLLLAWWARSDRRRVGSETLVEVAQNPRTPRLSLAKLFLDVGGDEVAAAVAANPNASARTVAAASRSGNPWVAAAAAGHPKCHPDDLAWLAEVSLSSDVRSAVAANPNTPAGALAVLAGDGDGGVRAAVAANPASPSGARAQVGLLAD
mgnify:CR=1 FL=1